MSASEARGWAAALADSILADTPILDWIGLADRVHDAMVADGCIDAFDSSAELQVACESAARAAIAREAGFR